MTELGVGDVITVREADRADWAESCELYGLVVPSTWTGKVVAVFGRGHMAMVDVELGGVLYEACSPESLERS